MEQTYTMMAEEETPEVGPNDIVIHLVNPYKCGMCELEFLDKTVFKDHIFTHLEQIKQEKPSSQIVVNIVLPPETPGGVTVTRDILQLGEDGSIKQVTQPANNITLNQVHPLKELEAAGVIKLEPPLSAKPAPVAPTISAPKSQSSAPPAVIPPNPLATKETQAVHAQESSLENMNSLEQSHNPVDTSFIKEEEGENDVSEIIENTDGTFSVAFKGPNNEMQHIQIIRPEGMRGEMMLELTNVHGRRRSTKIMSKSNECDICGKVLSSSTNLLRHKMYHSSERPFVCNTCGKGFKDVSNLKKHTMIHNRIFPCHLCKKSFLRKSLLALHLKRHQARTVFVKCGNGAKEVTLKTFVDDDGTRVEEMSMAALSGQTFEYKKRIVKADPLDLKPILTHKDETKEDAPNSDDVSADITAVDASTASVGEGSTDQNNAGPKLLGSESLLDHGQMPKERPPGSSGEAIDDLPDLKMEEPPKEFVKMYQCGHCGKRTVQRGNMMRHLVHHLNDKPFGCDECPKQFVDKGELVKHKKTHSKPYRCYQCNGAFAHNVQLMKHQEGECLGRTGELKYTVLEDGQTYRCNICEIEMKRLGNMIKHVGSHIGGGAGKLRSALKTMARKRASIASEASETSSSSGKPYTFNEKDDIFECNTCQKAFKQKANILNHIHMHTDEWAYECSNCNRSFQSKAELDKHSLVHLMPFKCDRCPAVFPRKIFLETHLRRHREKERGEETDGYGVSEDRSQYYCKHCDKKLTQKFRMMNHVRSHLDNRPYECSECNKCFSGQYMLSNHKKMHAKLFTCESCGEAFARKLFLQIHKKKYHCVKEDEASQSYSSSHVSDKSRSTVTKTQNRNLSQTNEKSYACSICGSCFSRSVIKMNHERKCREEMKILTRMSNGRGYQCKICQRVSTLKHNLMVHIKKAHSDLVKICPSGLIHMEGSDDHLTEEASVTDPVISPSKSADDQGSPPKKRTKTSRIRGNEDLSDDEVEALAAAMESEEEVESESDDRYTRIPGGYACATCRTKFSDRDTLFSHLKSDHQESVKSETDEQAKTEPKVDEKGDKKDVSPTEEENKSLQKENKTPVKGKGKSPGSSPSKSIGQSTKGSKPNKAPSTPSVNKRDTSATQTPTTAPRSSNRPPRTQKIPSRFLE